MDPDAALTNLLAAVAEIQRLEDLDIAPGEVPAHDLSVANAARDAAESADALHGWLSRGGFLPAAWAAGRQ